MLFLRRLIPNPAAVNEPHRVLICRFSKLSSKHFTSSSVTQRLYLTPCCGRPLSTQSIVLSKTQDKSDYYSEKDRYTKSVPTVDLYGFSYEAKKDVLVPEEARGKPKKLSNPPYVKNMFCNEFDPALLNYPEIWKNEDLDKITRLEETLTADLDQIAPPDEGTSALETYKDLLISHSLQAMQIPIVDDGRGMDYTATAKVFETLGNHDLSLAAALFSHHDLGLRSLLMYASDDQRAEYLPRVVNKKLLVAWGLAEKHSGSDYSTVGTRARLVYPEDDIYSITGSKTWVVNASSADVLIIFAMMDSDLRPAATIDKNTVPEEELLLTAFIVDRYAAGVNVSRPYDTIGLKELDVCEVTLDDVRVSKANILSTPGSGYRVANRILAESRIDTGAILCGSMKRLLAKVTKHVMRKERFGKKIYEYDLVKAKLAAIEMDIYAIEAMTYMLSRLMDEYRKPDLWVETAILKLFASEASSRCIREVCNLFGASYCTDNSLQLSRAENDMRIFSLFPESNDVLRMFISLSGLRVLGRHQLAIITANRNPLYNYHYVLRQSVKQNFRDSLPNFLKRQAVDRKLDNYVHPRLEKDVKDLDEHINNLHLLLRELLEHKGDDIVEEQQSLSRVADCATDLFLIAAVIARSSRSACIGLKNYDHEALTASMVAREAGHRLNANYQLLLNPPDLNGDHDKLKIADDVLKAHGNAAQHALTRNW